MDCPDFLDSYSDFRDGLIRDHHVRQQMREHLVSCVSCGRYDASVRHGVRAVGEVDLSPDFRDRLRQRIAATAGRPIAPAGPRATSVAAGLMVAAAVSLLVYERATEPVPTVARASSAPSPVPVIALSARTETRVVPLPADTDTLADSVNLPRAVAAPRQPMIVVNPGIPFVVFTDVPASPRLSGSPSVQTNVSLDNWPNLPR